MPTTVSCRIHLGVHNPDMLDVARHDGGNQRGGKGAICVRALGCGRTFAIMGSEENDFPHRW